MSDVRQWMKNFGAITMILGLLLAVTYLPPDNSLKEAMAGGSLRACVPPSYQPLVTGNAEQPGIDIEILKAITDRMKIGLALNYNDAIGRDFNPRNWGLNRAQCQIIAGGVVDSDQTRSFLETAPAYAITGWAMISTQPIGKLKGLNIGVLTLVSGLDRIGLASFLRTAGAKVEIVRTPEELTAGLISHKFDAGITEALLATKLASDQRWQAVWLPAELKRHGLVFGLWKGELTLKRAIDQAMKELIMDGTIAKIIARYAGKPLN